MYTRNSAVIARNIDLVAENLQKILLVFSIICILHQKIRVIFLTLKPAHISEFIFLICYFNQNNFCFGSKITVLFRFFIVFHFIFVFLYFIQYNFSQISIYRKLSKIFSLSCMQYTNYSNPSGRVGFLFRSFN